MLSTVAHADDLTSQQYTTTTFTTIHITTIITITPTWTDLMVFQLIGQSVVITGTVINKSDKTLGLR